MLARSTRTGSRGVNTAHPPSSARAKNSGARWRVRMVGVLLVGLVLSKEQARGAVPTISVEGAVDIFGIDAAKARVCWGARGCSVFARWGATPLKPGFLIAPGYPRILWGKLWISLG
ncbi:hypothetical protein D3C80_1556090 [compost metagenome]